ncbi:hypothetical protein Y032_0119g817 [Ancylostoma ceylanicum]|uniref:Uncharacterized protein n=1 Tax=Ancylostoma ceylanicum TaxID=53326 RepID=A0A016TB19_9BILA|nr:hypothetical protein Y032_0119g817 [Ancylostoma ceylanicum]
MRSNPPMFPTVLQNCSHNSKLFAADEWMLLSARILFDLHRPSQNHRDPHLVLLRFPVVSQCFFLIQLALTYRSVR